MKYPRFTLASPLSAAVLFISLSTLRAAEPPRPAGSPVAAGNVVSVYPDWILEKNFLGFGVQWEYEGDHRDNNVDNPVWMKRWPEIQKRIDFMRPAIFRVMHNALMYTRLDQDKIVPDYESPRMEVMYKVLDYAKSRNVPVVFGDWFLPGAYFKPLDGTPNPPPYGVTTNPRWTEEIVVPFLAHLREKRGYENIVYFNLMNEPWSLKTGAGVYQDFATWKTIILNLHTSLKNKGLADKVRIVGTDGPGDWEHWIEKTAKDPELRECIAAYEYHIYAHLKTTAWLPSLLEGKLGPGELLPRRLLVNAYDPEGPSKPFFMGEAGIGGDVAQSTDNQIERYGFSYGVWMADYAIQSINAGQAGLIAWDMDDAMHTYGSYGAAGLKGWGFWNSLAGYKGYPDDDFNLRPWFYTWSLLCRLFPAGSETLMTRDTGDPSCRVAAARLPDGKGFSFAVVNESKDLRDITLKLPVSEQAAIFEYRYFADERPADKDGFPVISAVHKNVDLASGFPVRLPGEGVVFLTTWNPADVGPRSKDAPSIPAP